MAKSSRNSILHQTQVRNLELVTAAGDLLQLSRDHLDPEVRDIFEAATIHLGALGVVTQVTIDVVDAFSVVKVTFVFLMAMTRN